MTVFPYAREHDKCGDTAGTRSSGILAGTYEAAEVAAVMRGSLAPTRSTLQLRRLSLLLRPEARGAFRCTSQSGICVRCTVAAGKTCMIRSRFLYKMHMVRPRTPFFPAKRIVQGQASMSW